MLPALCYVGNRLPIDADGDLERLGFVPMDNKWIRAFVCRRIQLARFNTGNMNALLEQFSRKQGRNRVGGRGYDLGAFHRCFDTGSVNHFRRYPGRLRIEKEPTRMRRGTKIPNGSEVAN